MMDYKNYVGHVTFNNDGVARKTLTALLQGHSGLSAEMAIKLAAAFDTTPEHWLNLQQQYILWQAEKRIDISKIKHFYQNEMSAH